MRRPCNVSRSSRFALLIVCTRLLAEEFLADGQGFSQQVERSEPKGNLDGVPCPSASFAANERRQTKPRKRRFLQEGIKERVLNVLVQALAAQTVRFVC